MADYKSTLSLDTSQHDQALNNAGNAVDNYAGKVNNAQKDVKELMRAERQAARERAAHNRKMKEMKGTFTDFAKGIGLMKNPLMGIGTAIGVGALALEGFKRTVNSCQDTQDAFNAKIEQGTAVLDSFFISIATGDLSPLTEGFDEIVRKAKQAYDAIDDLESFQIRATPQQNLLRTQLQDAVEKAQIAGQNGNEKEKANYISLAEEILKQSSGLTMQEARKEQKAAIKGLNSKLSEYGVGTLGLNQLLDLFKGTNFEEVKRYAAKQDELDELEYKRTGLYQRRTLINASSPFASTEGLNKQIQDIENQIKEFKDNNDTALLKAAKASMNLVEDDAFKKLIPMLYAVPQAQIEVEKQANSVERAKARNVSTKGTSTGKTDEDKVKEAGDKYAQSLETAKQKLDRGLITEEEYQDEVDKAGMTYLDVLLANQNVVDANDKLVAKEEELIAKYGVEIQKQNNINRGLINYSNSLADIKGLYDAGIIDEEEYLNQQNKLTNEMQELYEKNVDLSDMTEEQKDTLRKYNDALAKNTKRLNEIQKEKANKPSFGNYTDFTTTDSALKQSVDQLIGNINNNPYAQVLKNGKIHVEYDEQAIYQDTAGFTQWLETLKAQNEKTIQYINAARKYLKDDNAGVYAFDRIMSTLKDGEHFTPELREIGHEGVKQRLRDKYYDKGGNPLNGNSGETLANYNKELSAQTEMFDNMVNLACDRMDVTIDLLDDAATKYSDAIDVEQSKLMWNGLEEGIGYTEQLTSGIIGCVNAWKEYNAVMNDKDATDWEKFQANISIMFETLNTIMSTVDTVRSIISFFQELSATMEAMSAVQTVTTASYVAGQTEEAAATTASKSVEAAAVTAAAVEETAAVKTAYAAMTDAYTTAMAAASTAAYAAVPYVGPALAAAQIETMIGLIGAAKAQGLALAAFADGGIVQGANTIGDYNIARVNSGELIMNGTQQQRLWNIINGNSRLDNNQSSGGQVEFHVRGTELYGVLNNYNNKRSKTI